MQKQDPELTNINIVTPPDLISTDKIQIGVFGFDQDDFYKFLNAVPLSDHMIIYTIPIQDPHTKYFPWVKDVIKRTNAVFFNRENDRLVAIKEDTYKNVYIIDNTFETIKQTIMRIYGKKND